MPDIRTKSGARGVLEDIYHTHTEIISAKKRKNRDSQILFFIIMLGISGMVFGFWRMGNIIQKPLHTITAADIKNSYSETDINEKLAISLSEPLSKDTDSDGLTDSDETNIYSTSPYLEDTDSDGISDFDEIKKGTNPNCLGQNCDTDIQENILISPAGNAQNAAPTGEITASYLRSLLEKSGIESATIQTLSDKEILDVYYSAIVPQNQADVPSVPVSQGSDLQKMSPAELREFLKKGGMSEEMLDKFSDEEILQALKETMGEQK